MNTWNLEKIEAGFAAAALDPSLWRTALDVVSAETNAFGAVLFPAPGSVLPSLPYTESMTGCVEEYFRDGWYLKDERNAGLPYLMKHGVADDFNAMTHDRMRRHPYYQDYLASHGLKWFAAVRIKADDMLWILSIQREVDDQPFSPEEKGRLGRLVHTLPGSVALARAVGASNAETTLRTFELTDTAALLVNRQGRIYRMNAAATALLHGDVRIHGGRVVGLDNAATVALDKRLHQLIFSAQGGGLTSPVMFAREGQRPLLAYPARLPQLAANVLADCQAIVVLVDPDARKRPAVTLLRAVLDLTQAEAHLAAELASGAALKDVCGRLGISKETGRNQLKSIFSKTGYRRQAELVLTIESLLRPR